MFKAGERGLGYYFDGPDDDHDHAHPQEEEEEGVGSRHAQALAAVGKEAGALEEELTQGRPWMLKGEASRHTRPANALLELSLDFEQATKQAPLVTQELTDSLEEMIRKRCVEQRWEDVVRQAPASGGKERRKEEEVSTEKSKLGLGHLYAQHYATTVLGAAQEESLPKEHAAVNELMGRVCERLDALSNFHFTPKTRVSEVTVTPNVASIAMEEVLPLSVSAAQLHTPNEVYKMKGQEQALKAPSELTQAERHAKRLNKKRKNKKNIQAESARARAEGREAVAQYKTGRSATHKHSSLPGPEGGSEAKMGKSTTLFRALQEEALGAVRGLKAASSSLADKTRPRSAAPLKL